MVSSLNIVIGLDKIFFPPFLVLLDVLHQEQHIGVALHLGTDEIEHLVIPVCQRFVLQLPAEVIHQLVLIGVNRQPGNLVQPLAGQLQIGSAIGVEQLLFFKRQFHRLVPPYKKGPALCRPDVAKRPPCVVQGGLELRIGENPGVHQRK